MTTPLVLVVEDDRVMRLQLRAYLEREGYRIEEAEDGVKGLVAYQQLRPDIVLMDAVMPGLDGFECCQRLQALPGGSHTPVLIITGLEDEASVNNAFRAGATDFVTKPVNWAVLRQRVRRLIQQAQLQRQLEDANRELQRLACVDGLTHVANRRHFDEYLAQEWQRLMRERSALSLILYDVDFFKSYNDTYGHQAGDRCLQKVAQLLQTGVKRSADLVARYGGEEFAVLLPNTDLEGAIYLAEHICEQVRLSLIPHLRSPIRQQVTLSAGVASLIPDMKIEIESLIAEADQALYQAKALGRDRCCFSTSTLGQVSPLEA